MIFGTLQKINLFEAPVEDTLISLSLSLMMITIL
jgi:hypothetical protein